LINLYLPYDSVIQVGNFLFDSTLEVVDDGW